MWSDNSYEFEENSALILRGIEFSFHPIFRMPYVSDVSQSTLTTEETISVGDMLYSVNDVFLASSSKTKSVVDMVHQAIQSNETCVLRLIRLSDMCDQSYEFVQKAFIDETICFGITKSLTNDVNVISHVNKPNLQYLVGSVVCAVNEVVTLNIDASVVSDLLVHYHVPIVLLVACPIQKTVITTLVIDNYMEHYIMDIKDTALNRKIKEMAIHQPSYDRATSLHPLMFDETLMDSTLKSLHSISEAMDFGSDVSDKPSEMMMEELVVEDHQLGGNAKKDSRRVKMEEEENEGVDHYMFPRTTGYLILEKQRYEDEIAERDQHWKTYIEKVGGVANLSFSLTRQSGNRWKLINVTKQDKNREELRALIHSGIPERLRGEVWYHISGGFEKRASSASSASSTSFQTYYNSAIPSSVKTTIDHDLPRTFATHPLFHNKDMEAPYQLMLRHVLYGLAGLRPDIGYCQGLNYLGALLLLVQNDEEIAFWTLAAILEHLFPSDYFTEKLSGARVDEKVLEMLLKKQSPAILEVIERSNSSLVSYTLPWLICLFINSLPFLSVVRVWDVIMFEGDKALLRIALALISVGESSILKCRDTSDLALTFRRLGILLFDVDSLLDVAYQVSVAEGAKEKVVFFRRKELEKWRKDVRRQMGS